MILSGLLLVSVLSVPDEPAFSGAPLRRIMVPFDLLDSMSEMAGGAKLANADQFRRLTIPTVELSDEMCGCSVGE